MNTKAVEGRFAALLADGLAPKAAAHKTLEAFDDGGDRTWIAVLNVILTYLHKEGR